MMFKEFIYNKKTYIGLLISLILIFIAVKDFNMVKFYSAISNVKIAFVCISMFLLIIVIYLRALRWRLFFINKPSTQILFKAQFIGYFCNNVMPLRIGELIRANYIGNKCNKSKPKVFGIIILERIFDLFGCLFLLLLLVNTNLLANIDAKLYYLLLIISIVCFLGIFASFKLDLHKLLLKINHILSEVANGFSILNKKNIIPSVLLTILIWLIYIIEVYLVQYAFGMELDLHQCIFILLVSSLFMILPAMPGNFGTFESSVVYSLGIFNIIDDFGFSFILHFVSFIPYTIIGCKYFISEFKFISNINIQNNN